MLEHGRTEAPQIPRPVEANCKHSQSPLVEHEADTPQVDGTHGNVVWTKAKQN